jgi:hypothetical protein
MRHYHPDSNPDPEAHIRAQAITAAYAVLRDPAKRAKYDAERRDGDVWRWTEPPPRPARPPAARNAGIAAAVLSVLMVGTALLLPPRDQPTPRVLSAPEKQQASPAPAPTQPLIELEPESERLADLRGDAELQPPAIPPPEVPIQQVRSEPLPGPVSTVRAAPALPQVRAEPPPAPLRTVREARPLPLQRPAKPARPQVAQARRVPAPAAIASAPKALAQASKPAPPRAAPADASEDRVATLQRISAGFYSQSLEHADASKKQLLLSVRIRQTYKRATCRSNSCVADSYLRQIREVSAIMENRAAPGQ